MAGFCEFCSIHSPTCAVCGADREAAIDAAVAESRDVLFGPGGPIDRMGRRAQLDQAIADVTRAFRQAGGRVVIVRPALAG